MSRRCRFCMSKHLEEVVSLGTSPLANVNIPAERLDEPEVFLPLDLRVCQDCLLGQVDDFQSPAELFEDYAHSSSWSDARLACACDFAAAAAERFALGPDSRVLEVASNDGYLLQYFVQRGIPVLGIEPAANVAAEAEGRGVPTTVEFFGADTGGRLAAEGYAADLIVANNVLARVPDLNGFVAGLRNALKPDGVLSVEFPHFQCLIEETQFDTIYHEHLSYFFLSVALSLFDAHGLRVFDVEDVPTHGDSLRLFAARSDSSAHLPCASVEAALKAEHDAGIGNADYYESFAERTRAVKRDLLAFLIEARGSGRRIAGYGAPAKGNTLLNYCGIRTDLLDYIVDRNPRKQGLHTPGTRIPIHSPDMLRETKPDYILILPWNIREEVMDQMSHIREWGGRFVVAIPELLVLE